MTQESFDWMQKLIRFQNDTLSEDGLLLFEENMT